MSVIYGPVPSWRLGRSLGVDPVSSKGKTCSFDCIYCQLGRTKHPLTERRNFIQVEHLIEELKRAEGLALDYITFSGVAEPTLAVNLGPLVRAVRERSPHPIAILTNSSLMVREDVRQDLALFDLVAAKVDAPNEALFQAINRPFVPYGLEEIVEGIRRFRDGFTGRLALQMMFVEANKDHASEMAQLARELTPDEVQLNTPLRPSPVRPLSPGEMELIEEAFKGLNVLNVYKAQRAKVMALDESETQRRRPRGSGEGVQQLSKKEEESA